MDTAKPDLQAKYDKAFAAWDKAGPKRKRSD